MNYYEKFYNLWSLLNVSRETFLKLEKFVSLLTEENKIHNLIRYSSLEELWQRHIIDSVQLSLYVSRETKKIIDLGSGNGCPGVILSIVFPEKELYLIESKKKKVEFLKKCVEVLSLEAQIHDGRIEDSKVLGAECITARAVADLAQLLDWTQKMLNNKTYCIFPKGKKWEEELKNAQKKWQFIYKVHNSLTDSSGQILSLSEISKRKIY